MRVRRYDTTCSLVGTVVRLGLDAPEESDATIRHVATCKSCGEEVDVLVSVKSGKKAQKVCEDCADRLREQEDVLEASEGVVQEMMGFKGRR
jgi:hypothetical protein